MDKNQKALTDYFNSSWDKMLELLELGRSTEFLIRMASELHAHEDFIKAGTWDEFKTANHQIERKKLDKHIDDIWGANKDKIQIAKHLADKLAHADYLGARNRIEAYQRQFGLDSVLNSDPARIMKAENVQHEDGTVGAIKYLLTSSDQNLTVEEFMVFDQQGYTEAAREILNLAENEINTAFPNIRLKCSALVLSRGLKFGVK